MEVAGWAACRGGGKSGLLVAWLEPLAGCWLLAGAGANSQPCIKRATGASIGTSTGAKIRPVELPVELKNIHWKFHWRTKTPVELHWLVCRWINRLFQWSSMAFVSLMFGCVSERIRIVLTTYSDTYENGYASCWLRIRLRIRTDTHRVGYVFGYVSGYVSQYVYKYVLNA